MIQHAGRAGHRAIVFASHVERFPCQTIERLVEIISGIALDPEYLPASQEVSLYPGLPSTEHEGLSSLTTGLFLKQWMRRARLISIQWEAL